MQSRMFQHGHHGSVRLLSAEDSPRISYEDFVNLLLCEGACIYCIHLQYALNVKVAV